MLVARALRTCSRSAVAGRSATRRGLQQSAVAAARACTTARRGVHIAALYRTPAPATGQPRGPAGASDSAAAATAVAGAVAIPPLSNAHLIVTPPAPAPAVTAASGSAADSSGDAAAGAAFVIEPVEPADGATATAAEADGDGEGEGEGDGESEEPWYAQGLKFGCTACGKCCTGRGGVVRVNEQEILALSAHLGLTYQQFGRKYLRYDREEARFHLRDRPERRDTDGACVFLDGKTCSVYAARPAQCRTFPFWPRFVESKQKWDEMGARRCEGVNHPNGRVWSGAEVYAESQIQTLHDSGENYTYDEMHGVLEHMQAAERAAHNDFVRTALGAQQPAPAAADDADAETEVDPSSDAAIEAAVKADALARAEAAAILAKMPLELQVDAKGNVVSSAPAAAAAAAAPKPTAAPTN